MGLGKHLRQGTHARRAVQLSLQRKARELATADSRCIDRLSPLEGEPMKAMHTIAAVALATAASATVYAQQETRDEVKAETAQAKKDGQIPTGDLDKKPADVAAARRAASSTSGLTRAQVSGEAKRAEKAGQLPTGDLDEKPADLANRRAAAKAPTSGLTRDQVRAETQASQRAGQNEVGDLGKTQAEKDPPRYAGAPASVPKLHLKHRAKNVPAASQPSS